MTDIAAERAAERERNRREAREREERALEYERVADGWAQLAWTVQPLSVRAAKVCARVSDRWQGYADVMRNPWWLAMGIAGLSMLGVMMKVWRTSGSAR